MRIAFIHCPFGHRIFSENLKVVDEDFCLAPPIILAYVAAIAEKAGHEVRIIDAHSLRLSKEKVLDMLKDFSPDMVGFRADTYWFHTAVEWARFLKERMQVKVLVGGINITLYPEESFSYDCFDYAIAGEAAESLPALLCAIERGQDLSGVHGLLYRKGGKAVFNPPSDKVVPFDDYPFPARHLLPNNIYRSFLSQRRNYTIMLSSTGCPYNCRFCAIARIECRYRDPLKVTDEIEQCYKDFAVREIDFFDGTFFFPKERGMKICEEIIKRKIKLDWSCRSRVDVVDEDILKIAAAAGCKKVYYGIESSSEEVLGNISKGINRKAIFRAVNLTRKHGINTLGFFMVGNPGDDRKSIEASIRLAKMLKLDFVQVCRTIAKPNTDLHDLLIERYGRDYWKEYILGTRKEERLPNPWSSLSEEEIEGYLRRFYNEFYFRPGYMLRRVCKARSPEELFHYFRSGLRWFFRNYSDVGRVKKAQDKA
jgi:radical SAM superfamily enzyme YgiQ (UPF0313 family)